VQVLLNGIVNGGTIALIALAFSFAYLPTGVFHLALAGIYVLAPYFFQTLLNVGFGWPLSAVLAIIICGVLSAACEMVNHRPLARKNVSSNVHLVSSLGLYILFSQSAALIWGNNPRTLRTVSDSIVTCLGLTLTRSQMYELLCDLGMLTATLVLLRMSRVGLQLRGLADNPREMMLSGCNVWNLRLFAFFLSGLLAACASLCSAYDYGYEPNSGLTTLFVGAVAVMIGGRQLFWAPLIGGLALGILRSEVVWVLSARWQEAATFVLLVLILLFRPDGLLGSKRRLETQ
jgi:branched-chain amino acid transport system permease protein